MQCTTESGQCQIISVDSPFQGLDLTGDWQSNKPEYSFDSDQQHPRSSLRHSRGVQQLEHLQLDHRPQSQQPL